MHLHIHILHTDILTKHQSYIYNQKDRKIKLLTKTRNSKTIQEERAI